VPIVGSTAQVVDGLRALSDAGLDGVLVVFPRYEAGLREFRDLTYPLLKQAGLRDFA
jgi:alkanesulfonate monooxygenase SsuD/methylene tetrahydromethanopterin reductase-like flavin-dependent oxidoreductase (luciferase family)